MISTSFDWTESLKEMQRNWIGRSEGAEVRFALPGRADGITVFTTRPDTLFGATYMVLAPEHKLVDEIAPAAWPDGTPQSWRGHGVPAETPAAALRAYRDFASGKSDLERTELAKDKTGVFTGAFAVNPVNGARVPIWVADYVLATYGTGAIMAVPAHDTRDLEFARKFRLPVTVVVQPPDVEEAIGFTGDGVSVNSDFLNGLPTPEAKKRVTAWLGERQAGRKTVNFKLRDWLFSRQRYWGAPMPVVWRNGGHMAVEESELPLLPPDLSDFKPTGAGEPPLARAKDWVNLPDGSTRETNTMPQWAGSCWYYLRYLDARNPRQFCAPAIERYWMGTEPTADPVAGKVLPGVDLYVGGAEHAVLHLLYARFWHKVLYDLGFVSTAEPFHKLVNQGLILGEDGPENVQIHRQRGQPGCCARGVWGGCLATLRNVHGAPRDGQTVEHQGVEGVYRFLGRVWRLFVDEGSETEFEQSQAVAAVGDAGSLDKIQLHPSIRAVEPSPARNQNLHACIKKVTEDLDGLRFNTAISALMVFVNEAISWETKPASVLETFLHLLQPFAPPSGGGTARQADAWRRHPGLPALAALRSGLSGGKPDRDSCAGERQASRRDHHAGGRLP